MRIFYAIEFDERTKDLLSKEQGILKVKALKANMTRRENLHLTLRFIGEVNPSYIPVFTNILNVAASNCSPFQLTLTGPGAFARGNKSIIWWGVEHSAALHQLYEKIEEQIRRNGFPAENRPYTPHITLAREFTAGDGNIESVLDNIKPLNHSFPVKNISLMESTRIDGKLKYICLFKAALKKNKTE
ncbi:MAG TPA: RNA 2',3'-cyclic phosphodiesterase [Ruminiclostridium sp.]|jgi:2'-5' RNA ligase|nr:RNA 2',3'-cyclic phosphodiesterase [Clostridiaceae bacterium]HAA24535.1 RNA 2',3'-cyclic phosphodiesterase [Ruminiclostridium sp.]